MLVCRLLLSAMPPPLFSPNPLSSMRRQATRMKRHIRALLFVLPFRTAAFSTRPPPTRPFGATTTTTTTSAASPSPTPRHRPRITHQGPRRPGRWRRSVATGYGGGGGGMDDEGRTTVGGGMKILGICGGIGSGKSTACRLMVDSLGCAARIGERRWDMMVTSMMTHALRLYFIVAQFFFFFLSRPPLSYPSPRCRQVGPRRVRAWEQGVGGDRVGVRGGRRPRLPRRWRRPNRQEETRCDRVRRSRVDVGA